MANEFDNSGCGCLIIAAFILLMVAFGGFTVSCGGVYLGPIPKVEK